MPTLNLSAVPGRSKEGVKLWSYPIGATSYPSLAVANGLVYVGSDNGKVYALKSSTGALSWVYATQGRVSSPAVANGVVYVGSYDSNVYALNAKTGALLWVYATGAGVESLPTVANGSFMSARITVSFTPSA